MRIADVDLGERYWWGDFDTGITVVAHGRMGGKIHVTLDDGSTAEADPEDLHPITVGAVAPLDPARLVRHRRWMAAWKNRWSERTP